MQRSGDTPRIESLTNPLVKELRELRSCVAAAPLLTCAIGGLDAATKHSVRLRAYTVPAGPSSRSVAVKVTTKR